jgi:hypothetical protein
MLFERHYYLFKFIVTIYDKFIEHKAYVKWSSKAKFKTLYLVVKLKTYFRRAYPLCHSTNDRNMCRYKAAMKFGAVMAQTTGIYEASDLVYEHMRETEALYRFDDLIGTYKRR